jgi:uncharacterized protein (DUF1015 family)
LNGSISQLSSLQPSNPWDKTMADIFPFRGISFDPEKAGSYGSLVTQPYDKISPEMKQRYLQASSNNIVRVILPAGPGADDDSVYEKAAETYEHWLAEGILRRETTPGFYPYHQTYRVPGGSETRTRKGFIGLGQLYDYADRVIRPHEHTHSGPKVDRLKLTRATGSQFGQLFMLYSDPEYKINGLFDSCIAGREPFIRVQDEYGVTHSVWKVDDEDAVRKIQELMRGKNMYIADGHHRYETALNWWREKSAQGVKAMGDEAISHAMMSFVCVEDPGLSVLPTHRVVFGLRGFDPEKLLGALKADFDISPAGPAAPANLAAQLKVISGENHSFVFSARGLDNLQILRLRPEVDLSARISGPGSQDLKGLDVTILHKVIIEPRLGIDEKSLERADHVTYVREPEEALALVTDSNGAHQAVFFLNSTRVDQVVAVADRGECMPQKSTDFYPKMLTGLVINKVNL